MNLLTNTLHRRWSCLLLIIAFMSGFQMFAQSVGASNQLTGRVLDEYDQPIIGAVVKVSGTSIGRSTDADGAFTMKDIPANATLEVSYVGYEKQSIPVNGKNFVLVKLKEANQLLNEVVVVGYGTQKKVNLTGAVGTISAKEINARPVSNVAMALQGADPSMNLKMSSGRSSSGYDLNIRGESSISTSNTPLIMVDGVVTELNMVNPNDIVAQYGADTMRLHIMFIGDFEKAVTWSNEAVKGSKRFLDRCWNLMELAQDSDEISGKNASIIHKTIKKVTTDIDDLKMNTAIAALMAMVNEFYASGLTRGDLQQLMLMLSPFAPHMVEEMWELTGYAAKTGKMAMQMPWPTWDESKTVDSHVEMAVQVNGKLKGTVTVAMDSDEETVKAAALALDKVFPGDKKIVNMCDQPVNLLQAFAKILRIDRSELHPEYIGLNHFGWFTQLQNASGQDLMPQLREKILRDGFAPADAAERDASWLETYSTVKAMVRDFPNYIPNTYLQYYLYPQEVVERLDPIHTRTEEVENGRQRRVFEECARVQREGTAQGSSIAKNEAHADMIVEVAASIAYDEGRPFIMITRNDGVITNFHQDAMVECLAHVGKGGVQPVPFGEIDVFMKGLMEGQYAYETLTVEAYFEKSYEKALKALTLNRTLVDAQKARAVLDDLQDANQGYWPELL